MKRGQSYTEVRFDDPRGRAIAWAPPTHAIDVSNHISRGEERAERKRSNISAVFTLSTLVPLLAASLM